MKKMLMLNILKLSLIGVFYTPQCIDSTNEKSSNRLSYLNENSSTNDTDSDNSQKTLNNNRVWPELGKIYSQQPKKEEEQKVQKPVQQGNLSFKNPPQTVQQGNLSFKNSPQTVQQVQKKQKPVQNEMQKIDPNKCYYKCLNLTDQSHKNIADKFKSLAEEFQLTQENTKSHKEILLKFVNLTERGKESIYVNREVVTSAKKLHTTVCSGCSDAECNKTDCYDQNIKCRGTFHMWDNKVNIVNNNFSEKKWRLTLKLDTNLDGKNNSHVILVRDMPGNIGDEFRSFLNRTGDDAKKVKIEFEKTPKFLERNNDKNQF